MSVILLAHGRATPLTFLLGEGVIQKTQAELRTEGYILKQEIERMREPSKWHFMKGIRLIEIGTLLSDATLTTTGDCFLARLYT